MQISGKLDAGMIIKIGPSAAMWKELGKRMGFHNLWAQVRLMIMKANVRLPKVAAQGIEAPTEEVSAVACVRTLYGMETLSNFDETVARVKREASQKAADDMH